MRHGSSAQRLISSLLAALYISSTQTRCGPSTNQVDGELLATRADPLNSPVFQPVHPVRDDDALPPTPASFSVSPTGVANWSMAISVPDGRNGIQPALAINYSSKAGAGLLGHGFSLSGLSSISRCWKSPAVDGTFSATATAPQAAPNPHLGVPDAFCLDGQRLVPLNTSGHLRPEFDPGTRVEVLCTNEGLSCDGFIVSYKDGRRAYFGTTPNSRHQENTIDVSLDRNAQGAATTDLPVESVGAPVTLEWHLAAIEDRWGNGLGVEYEARPGELLPKRINWTTWAPTQNPSGRPPAFGNSARPATRSLEFVYRNEPRIDIRTAYRQGALVRQQSLLESIRVSAEDRLVSDARSSSSTRMFREYRFAYQPFAPGKRRLDRLTSITECISNGLGLEATCLPSTSFTWSGLNTPFVPEFEQGAEITAPGELLVEPDAVPKQAYDVFEAATGDFNGDGFADLLYRLPVHSSTGYDATCDITSGCDEILLRGRWVLRLGGMQGLGAPGVHQCQITYFGMPRAEGLKSVRFFNPQLSERLKVPAKTTIDALVCIVYRWWL